MASISENDHTVPWSIANAAYKRQRRNPAVTEIVKIPNRGHSLTIDHGWPEVAQTALDFVSRFVPSSSASQRVTEIRRLTRYAQGLASRCRRGTGRGGRANR